MTWFASEAFPWRQVKRNDSRARELADRHYSRQTPGAVDFMASGRTFVLLAEFSSREPKANGTEATWGAIENLDPAGGRHFRVSIFRNETPWISSYLVRSATTLTQQRWRRKFWWDGVPPLRTEVDAEKTRRKRDPGRCFRKAGWHVVGLSSKGLVVLGAPMDHLSIRLVTAVREAAEGAFALDTAAPGTPNTPNLSAGHCTMVAMLVRERLGGEFVSASLSGLSHWFNRLKVGEEWIDVDLTGDQFGRGRIQYAPAGTLYENTRARSAADINAETRARYAQFSSRVQKGGI